MFLDSKIIQWTFLGLPLATLALGFCLSISKPNAFIPSILIKLRAIEFIGAFGLLLDVFLNQSFEFDFFSATFFSRLNIEFGLRADELSTIVLSMITLLSYCIFKYSVHYLEGDLKKQKFFRDYQFTVFFVVLLVIANNLAFFFVAWLGISYGLHKLLLHFNTRPKALLAAKKKWFVSRIGDISLLIAIILTIKIFKTLNFPELIAISHHAGMMHEMVEQKYFSFIGIFIVIGAMTKSAQFPFHFWLPETMETPTPVSALMHAGIINAGGYLVIRVSPILIYAPFAHVLLISIGGITAVFGSLIMMTQTDIKKQLAYSTISQLGFMMIQCGIGAYTFALFHMIAHGFYKAYSFLSTPEILIENKAPKRNLTNYGLIFSYYISGIMIFYAFYNRHNYPFNSVHLIYFGILSLALTQVIGSKKELIFALNKNTVYTISFFIFSFLIYSSFEFLVSSQFNIIMPNIFDTKIVSILSVTFLFFIFSFGIYLAKNMQDISNNKSKKIWLFFWNGCYFPALSSKVFKL